MITLGSSSFRVILDEDQGGEIIHLGPDSANVLAHYGDWESPVSRTTSASYDAGGPLDWLSSYRGGWQCLLPNAGDPCTVGGVPLPFHGEWSRTRLDVMSVSENKAILRSGTRLPLVARRTVEILDGRNVVRVSTTLRNVGPGNVSYVWGEHPAFALSAGARIHIPAGRVEVDATLSGPLADLTAGASGQWPRVPSSTGSTDLSIVPGAAERLCYLVDVEEPWAVAVEDDTAISLAWDGDAFPHLWFWQERGGAGFPWYGRAGITAIEPATHWPSTGGLAGAITRGQARVLEPGATATSWTSIGLSRWSGGRPVHVDADGTVEYEGAENV